MESIAPANAAVIIPCRIHHPATAQEKNHDECHRRVFAAGGDSKYKGSGDGIMEKGLQKVTGQRQCTS